MKNVSMPSQLLSYRSSWSSRCSTSTHWIIYVQQLLKQRLDFHFHGLPRPTGPKRWWTTIHM